MKKNPILLCLFTGTMVALSLSARADDARSIFEKFETQKAEALAGYLQANPEAEDARLAESMLVSAYMDLDESVKAAPLLRKQYDGMSKGADADLQLLVGGVIQPLFQAYMQAGDKDSAGKFIATAQEDLKSHPQASQIMQFLGQFAARLSMPTVGDTLEIAYTAIDGREVDLSKMEDKVVLVEFWATWCPPCIAELPNIVSAHKKYSEKGFEVLAISLDQDKGALEGFVEQRGLPWPQYLNGSGDAGDLAEKYGVQGIPATFLVGKDGKIVATDLHGDSLERQLSKLLSDS